MQVLLKQLPFCSITMLDTFFWSVLPVKIGVITWYKTWKGELKCPQDLSAGMPLQTLGSPDLGD